jgi:hypothetical protein
MKRINRRTKTTILIVGEGRTEKAFLQYLQELYISREADKTAKVQRAYGGSPEDVVWKAVSLRKNRDYDYCYVLIDSIPEFKPDSELLNAMNLQPLIKILYSTPCIEGLFLDILEHRGFSKSGWNSEKCKSWFEKKYIPSDKKTDKRSYGRYFSKKVIEDRKIRIEELNKIVSIFT